MFSFYKANEETGKNFKRLLNLTICDTKMNKMQSLSSMMSSSGLEVELILFIIISRKRENGFPDNSF